MASIGEIIAAEVIIPSETVLYEIDTDLKGFTVEELYVRLDQEVDTFNRPYTVEADRLRSQGGRDKYVTVANSNVADKKIQSIISYLCELYRRNITHHEKESNLQSYPKYWWEVEGFSHHKGPNGERIVVSKEEKQMMYWHMFQSYKSSLKSVLAKLQNIKKIHLNILDPIDKKINDLMDSILDANGNKISMFKDYLTDEQYRHIRAGLDVKDIKDPAGVLASLQRMKTEMKR